MTDARRGATGDSELLVDASVSRKRYQTPRLRQFGLVTALTATNLSVGRMDGGPMNRRTG